MSNTKTGLSRLELERIAPLTEAAKLRGVHPDTLRATDPDKIVRISVRRDGMRVRDALKIKNED
jgi:hypothetical protein